MSFLCQNMHNRLKPPVDCTWQNPAKDLEICHKQNTVNTVPISQMWRWIDEIFLVPFILIIGAKISFTCLLWLELDLPLNPFSNVWDSFHTKNDSPVTTSQGNKVSGCLIEQKHTPVYSNTLQMSTAYLSVFLSPFYPFKSPCDSYKERGWIKSPVTDIIMLGAC